MINYSSVQNNFRLFVCQFMWALYSRQMDRIDIPMQIYKNGNQLDGSNIWNKAPFYLAYSIDLVPAE